MNHKIAKRGLRLTALFSALITAGGPAAADDVDAWPREFTAPGGARIVVYQPQLDGLEGDQLKGRAAVSVTLAETSEAVFGAVWFDARIHTDRDTRMVSILDIQVPRVRFAEATPEQEKKLASLLEKEVPTWSLDISLDRVLTALGATETRRQAAAGLENEPPEVLFATSPTVLVLVDGAPRTKPIPDSDYEYVINSPFVIVRDPKSGNLYLYAARDTWYAAGQIEGPWVVAPRVTNEIRELIPEDVDQQIDETTGAEPPALVVRTKPAELIVSEGAPEYKPLAGGELLQMSNTESDVVMEIATQRLFVLLSGRWFASKGTDGPWTFVASDELPASFQSIESDGEMAHLRSWVAGTVEADEAVLDAQIPQTASIKRNATIEVTYDGAPKFEAIPGTDLEYAVNTPTQVIKYGKSYYAVDSGVWYQAAAAPGPWSVAAEIPGEIYEQPASSPTYNTTYVYVYDSTPSVVYTGYYPGYMYSYPYHGCLVYGTGYHYTPWYGSYYYPRHATWGFHASWNSYSGWSLGFSYSTGPFTFGMSWGGWGGSYRGGYYPPGGYYGYGRAYNRGVYDGARAGYRAGYRQGRQDQFRQDRNLYNRGQNRDRVARSTRPSASKRPASLGNRPNNVYADRSGNVHRRTSDGSWQQRDRSGWSSGQREVSRPSSGRATSGSRAGSGTRSQSSSLSRDYQARQRGAARSQSFRGGGRSFGRRP